MLGWEKSAIKLTSDRKTYIYRERPRRIWAGSLGPIYNLGNS